MSRFDSPIRMKNALSNLAVAGILCCFLVSCAKKSTPTSSLPSQPVLFTAGSDTTLVEEFVYVYDKNNSKTESAYTEASLQEYLNLFVNFKLMVNEARAQGLDTTEAFKMEFEGYRKQLAQPYLSEKKVTEQLVTEAYDRMQEEVNASHLLVNCAADAEPADTLAAFNKATEFLRRARAGESFEALAQQSSDDKSAQYNQGNLGYFSVFDMVYPFESAAYGLRIGEFTGPVRTRFGYHVIKLNDRRPSRGKVRVAHIMIRATADLSPQDSVQAYRKVEEIYNRLKKGEDWNTVCQQFSEDVDTRDRGGELAPFASGTSVPTFEEAAFGLQNKGDISTPVKTPYGWHIVKLMERIGMEPFKQAETGIRNRIAKDSRAEQSKMLLLTRLKAENGFKEFKNVLDYLRTKADSSIFEGVFTLGQDDKNRTSVLASIGNNNLTVQSFLEYAQGKKRFKKDISPAHYVTLLYNAFVDDQILKYEEANLSSKHKDYRMLLKEYKEGMLLFTIKEQNVWNKGVQDTTGLQKFFERNQGKYQWEQRANLVMLESPSEQVLQKAVQKLDEPRYISRDIQMSEVQFAQGSAEVSAQDSLKLRTYVRTLYNNASLTVEITGTFNTAERTPRFTGIAARRAKAVKDVLVHFGVPADRLILMPESKDKKGKPQSSNDTKVSFAVFTSSKKGIEALVNEGDPLAIKITEGKFQQKDLALLSRVPMEAGKNSFVQNGKFYYILIHTVEPPRAKTLDESKGQAISDYQQYLEEEWVKELKMKFPVQISEPEFKKLIKN
jgi:peptidyl-prolyl cis-trans isomerase SurA